MCVVSTAERKAAAQGAGSGPSSAGCSCFPGFTALQGRLQRQGALLHQEAGISVSLKVATAPAWLGEMLMLLLRRTTHAS